MSWWKTVAREPLVHFLVVGAALFALDRWRGGETRHEPREAARGAASSAPAPAPAVADPADRRIVVDAAVLAELTTGLTRRHERPPTESELGAEVERWIDQEILFREATLRGLDRDDPIVRQRVAAKMGFVVEQAVVVPEPSEAELTRWFAEHRERWSRPERIDFIHVFVDGTDAAAAARADALLAQLEAGTAPETLGDRFSGGRRYRGRKLADLAQTFGDAFVVGLDTQPAGKWARRGSRFGFHLVRVDGREGGHEADFETARPDVRKDWMEARRAEGVAEALRRLRERWEIVRS